MKKPQKDFTKTNTHRPRSLLYTVNIKMFKVYQQTKNLSFLPQFENPKPHLALLGETHLTKKYQSRALEALKLHMKVIVDYEQCRHQSRSTHYQTSFLQKLNVELCTLAGVACTSSIYTSLLPNLRRRSNPITLKSDLEPPN